MQVQGGHIPGTLGRAAFSWQSSGKPEIPVVIAAPHGGRIYPPAMRSHMRELEQSALKLEDRYVDLLAEAIMRRTGAGLLIAHAPRAMIDLNRAPDDVDISMLSGLVPVELRHRRMTNRARSGLGLVPRRLGGIGEIWNGRLPYRDLVARIESVHRPYHAQLAGMLHETRQRWGAALLLDLHSMPPLGPKHGVAAAPDFVVGDRFGGACDAQLCARALSHLGASGWLVAHNRPYSGGYVLDRHAAPRHDIHAFQLEICRTTYLNKDLRDLSDDAGTIIEAVAGMVHALVDEVVMLGGRNLDQAAE
ncbi:N-formylglutamate amidohydrolase [Altericroceibacterium spongiae]|uniref:N-formylglutamate amidohydrolase n=2 Tax=Altericroceibacterium spongiae TaxID=2320269 RepID=A0A420EFI7_9SPHN|nr:N-formylglutamate amidohydrolase [Altericroceibacterium spongiae]